MHIHRIEVYPEDSVIHPSKNRGVIGKLPTTRRLLVVMQRFSGQKHCVTTQMNEWISDGKDNRLPRDKWPRKVSEDFPGVDENYRKITSMKDVSKLSDDDSKTTVGS